MARPGQLRIIGGRWRGRRLDVVDRPGLRPTPDRVRETLFNWLAPILPGARCIDLFAGTGALGLEALSRGADSCLFVEQDRALAANIAEHLQVLGGDAKSTRNADAITALSCPPGQGFDCAFVDPPFGSDLLEQCLPLLGPHLRAGHRVYLEYPAGAPPLLPPGWQLHRNKRAGQVGYALASVCRQRQDTQT